jgi:hypothetical protein
MPMMYAFKGFFTPCDGIALLQQLRDRDFAMGGW